jgi:hypothetical protein
MHAAAPSDDPAEMPSPGSASADLRLTATLCATGTLLVLATLARAGWRQAHAGDVSWWACAPWPWWPA